MRIHRLRSAVRERFTQAGIFDRIVRRRTFDGVMVLCYHAVRGDAQADGAMPFEGLHVRRSVFEAHCGILARLCNPISLARWRKAVAGEATLPARPVLVTFDDGYRSVLTEALPVLERHEIPATVFVCSDAVARGEMFWHDAVASTQGEAAVAELKTAPYPHWLCAFERARQPVARDHAAAPLSPSEVGGLASHPLLEVGGHSHRHPILARADESSQRAEIVDNVQALESWTGKPVRSFAYPNGRAELDYTALTEQLVGQAGIDQAFGTDSGFAPLQRRSLSQPRFMMVAGLTAAHLLHRLAWLWR